MSTKNTYKISDKFEIVSQYMQNQTESNWYKMLANAMEFELQVNWEDERKNPMRELVGVFKRMSEATKDITN